MTKAKISNIIREVTIQIIQVLSNSYRIVFFPKYKYTDVLVDGMLNITVRITLLQ